MGAQGESHSSSGIIVSTGLGSTGWFLSLLTGAAGIAGAPQGGEFTQLRAKGFAWDSDHLYFTVRELFAGRTSQAALIFGRVSMQSPLVVVSQMPDFGVIFSDGVESDFFDFNSGVEATMGLPEKRGRLWA